MLEPTSFTNPPDLTGECMEWGCHHSEEMHGFEMVAGERLCRQCEGRGFVPIEVDRDAATCLICAGRGRMPTSAWVPKCRTEGCTCQGFSDVDTSEDPRREYGYGR